MPSPARSLPGRSIRMSSESPSLLTISESDQGEIGNQVDLPAPFRELNLDDARYFVMRSDQARDIETSVALGTWTASERVNKILNKAYLQSSGPILLIFSVTKSSLIVGLNNRNFCGIARVTSRVDFETTDPHWVEDVWTGRFSVDWIWLTEASFDYFQHIPVKNSPNYRMIACYDGTELSLSSGLDALRAFSSRAEEAMD